MVPTSNSMRKGKETKSKKRQPHQGGKDRENLVKLNETSEDSPPFANTGPIEATKIEQDQKNKEKSCVVRLDHVPYGFFEREMFSFFKQFGPVYRVRVPRSSKGFHYGYAFVQFNNKKVAEIVAQSMDNYLLAENRLRSRVLHIDELPKSITAPGGRFFPGKRRQAIQPGGSRRRHILQQQRELGPEQEARQRTRLARSIRKQMQQLAQLDVDYHFDFEKKMREFRELRRRGPLQPRHMPITKSQSCKMENDK